MAIKYGKGLRGALGRMPDVGYEYVPLPYKEMMAGNLMRQAAYDKSSETLDGISALYDQNFIDKDDQILNDQENTLNDEISSMVNSVGGDLGKLTGQLTSMYRKTANDKTYRNALLQAENRKDFYKELKKAKLDPGMAEFYLNKADKAYPGADKGVYSGVPYATLSQDDVYKQMFKSGKAVKGREITENVLGVMYKGMFIPNTDLDKYDLPEDELVPSQQQVAVSSIDPNDVAEQLLSTLGANPTWQHALSDYAEMNNLDYGEHVSNIITSVANNVKQDPYVTESKITPLPKPDKDTSGYDLTVPGQVLKIDTSDILSGKNEQGVTLPNMTYADKWFNLHQLFSTGAVAESDFTSQKSILSRAKAIAEQNLGFEITPEDVNSIKASERKGRENRFIFSKTGRLVENPYYKEDSKIYDRQNQISNALTAALEEITASSTFIPEYTMTVKMDDEQKEILDEFETAANLNPESILHINSVDRNDGEGQVKLTDEELNDEAIQSRTIKQISNRPIYNPENGQLEYKVFGTYLAEKENREQGEPRLETRNYAGSIPVSSTQRQLWDKLGFNPLTKTGADIARLDITGKVTTTDKLRKVSIERTESTGVPVNYGVTLVQDDSGKDIYILVEYDAETSLPIKYVEGPEGNAIFFSTLAAISNYIDNDF